MTANDGGDLSRQELEQLMDEDAFDQALKRLKGFLVEIDSPLRDAVGQQTALYNRLRKNEVSGKVTGEDADVLRARIRSAVLDIYDMATKSPEPSAPPGLAEVKVPDEVRLEAIIGANNLLRIDWLEKGLRAAMSVCRVATPFGTGTGFLIAPDVIMTNNHVIPNSQIAGRATVEFNDPPILDLGVRDIQSYQLDPQRFRTSSEKQLDYTIVGVLADSGTESLVRWGSLQLNPVANPIPDEHVVIIQHPGGGPKQIALTANQVVETVDYRLRYTTDTMRGSSGAPVFDQNWEVVALHHGSIEKLQSNVRGDKRFLNEGILLSAIKADAGDMWPT